MKNHIQILLRYILFILLLFIFHPYCEAPRNNPLDPENPDTSASRIKGSVYTVQLPVNPVSGVTVYWDLDKVYATTNQNGEFIFNNITPKDGFLRFQKTGFITESVLVTWNNEKLVNVSKPLNASPRMDSLRIYSVITNRYPAIKSAELVIKAKIRDVDNDIDSVYVKNEHLNLKKALKYNVNDQIYEQSFSLLDLNISSIQKATGYDFDVYVKDKFTNVILMGSDKVVRVIQDNIELITPINNQQVSPSPRFEWNEFNPGYKFTWAIEVYVDEIPPVVIWSKKSIAADSSAFTVDAQLPENDYFWMVWCIDEFQNRVRSKPASFTVKE